MASKFKKLPKKPKASASLDVWNRWHQRANEVKKFNAKVKADKKKKDALITKARGITNQSVR